MSSVSFFSVAGTAGYFVMYWSTSHDLSAPATAISHSFCLTILFIPGIVWNDSSVIPDSLMIVQCVGDQVIAIVVI
jgi:hypothetical protein